LYRHFPNRDALMQAVYRDDVEQLCAQAYELREKFPPERALAEWLRLQMEYVLGKRGLGAALIAALGRDSELFAWSQDTLHAAAAALLTDAQEAGMVRTDINATDLLRLGHSIGVSAGQSPLDAHRLLSVVLDGLRYPAPPSGRAS
jgi:AcrR family transcriptional regulator